MITPKVAAASPKVFALSRPNWAKVLPQAPADPWPPTIVTEPQISPSRGFCLNTLARTSPIVSCPKTNIAEISQNIKNPFPPFFNVSRSAPTPIAVKNTIINGFCSAWSNSKVAIPPTCNKNLIIANKNPPITGAGTQNFWKKLILLLKNLPM